MPPRSKLETLIASQQGPITRDILINGFGNIGLESGMTVLVHTSVSSLGWIPGGAQTLALCLTQALGPEGTLVVPTQSADLSDPVYWSEPPIPESWFEETRATMAPYDVDVTPTRGQGIFPEIVRTHAKAIRSAHPHTSFAALGARAEEITSNHALNSPLGAQSPLQKLYDLDASVLFLGTSWDSNTTFHLAEERLPNPKTLKQGAPMLVNGQQEWVEFEAVEYETDDFEQCGQAYEATGAVRISEIGRAQCRLFRIRTAVDFATSWFAQHRKP
ncbi:MAG: AAC(3) family N-acetyltransferase [Alphaproteobacteria bacterium]|nr:MAG: AAC(3) family N-acetyltransferase [Alphaproteobacteria bacterium]